MLTDTHMEQPPKGHNQRVPFATHTSVQSRYVIEWVLLSDPGGQTGRSRLTWPTIHGLLIRVYEDRCTVAGLIRTCVIGSC
jgi:hypothetical protein